MSDATESDVERNENGPQQPGSFMLGFFLTAGVFLPLAALLVELSSRWCAEELFDPIPTWWHVLLVAFVPVTNFQTWLAFQRGYTKRPGWLSFANAVSIFIALFYTVIFAPITPIAIIGILLIIGLLPLAPLFAFIAAGLIRLKMVRLYPPTVTKWFQWKALVGGFLFVIAAIGVAELNFTITRLGIVKANSTDARTQEEGVSLLRRFGDVDYLLRLSYDGSGVVSTDLILRFLYNDENRTDKDRSMSVQAQNAYYRLTGKHYRQVPIPRGVRHWDRIENWDDLDPTGTFRVNKGLSLAVSQIDGSVDADAALGYLEWTLVFANSSTGMQEAVSQIQLPPNAVVSRLTLWINDEEREAAFAKSARVIEAYKTVTAKRRDPALVTVTGKDRIQLKCFPVPAGGQMKVRLGITVPLVLENSTTGFLAMPYFQDRNFAISAAHSIWVESKRELEIANSNFVRESRENIFGVRGRVTEDDLLKIGSPIKVSRSAEIKNAWVKDSLNDGFFVRQELTEIQQTPINNLVVVVDASAQLAPVQPEIVAALRRLPNDRRVSLVLSGGNGLNTDSSAPNSTAGTGNEIADKLSAATFDGGTGAVPAIEKAWELANAVPGSAIVWIHGPQIVELDPPDRLTQLWTRRPTQVPIFSLQIGAGRNSVERVLNESNAVSTVLRFGSLAEDLTRLFRNLDSRRAYYSATWSVEQTSAAASANAKETSQHLVRLWANDETLRLLNAGESEKAIEVAVKNQLVTRVSGAVVLENQQQYDQFGLKPVDANSVPTIPEPEEYLLFAIVLFAMGYVIWRLRKSRLRTV